MEIKGSLLLVGLCPVSAITREPNENPIAFLERLRGPPKVYQSRLRLLQGTGDFKGQIPVSVCIRHQDKVTTAKQQDSAVSSDEMVQTATNTFYNREQERGAKAQEREKRKETGMPRCWPPYTEALFQTLSP